MATREQRIRKAASLPKGSPERRTLLADIKAVEAIANTIVRKLPGRWDSLPDYDPGGGSDWGDMLFSFGRDTDGNPMSPGDVVKAADIISGGLSKHRLRMVGGIRIFAQGGKILFNVHAKK